MKTDEELIKEFQDGSEEAFNDLVKRHINETYGFFIKFTADPVEAEDLAQDVFIKMYKALKNLDFNQSLKHIFIGQISICLIRILKELNGETYYTWIKLLSQSILILQMRTNGDVKNYGLRYQNFLLGKG